MGLGRFTGLARASYPVSCVGCSTSGCSARAVVGVAESCIEVYRAPAGDGYQEFQRYVAGEHFAPQALPDLVIEVGALLGA